MAAQFGVSLSFLAKLLRRQRTSGTVAAKPWNGGPAQCLDAAAQAQLVAWVGQQPDITLAELNAARGRTQAARVREHGLAGAGRARFAAQKKALHAAERDTPRVVALRAAFVEAVAQHENPRHFKFVDETALHLAFARRYGRAPGGQHVGQGVPPRVGTPVTLVGALYYSPKTGQFSGAC